MMQDVWLLEKLAHFDREVIPERRMHAKGWGAYGDFTVTHDITQYTKAKLFSEIGKKTDVFVRFSTVAGERGAADAERDIRGFACKFYTEEGNWDLVGNNTPTFFLRDVHNFPDLNRAVKRDPYTGMRSAQNNWDFWTLLPETSTSARSSCPTAASPTASATCTCSASTPSRSTTRRTSASGASSTSRPSRASRTSRTRRPRRSTACDRESAGRDLYDAIARGDFPRWTMYVQIMTEEQARNHYENPFDITKIWRHKEFPLIEVGVLELNRWPENYFAEVEQAAFTPAHVVPGIGFSPDKFLQGRLFVYGDAQRYRLGINHNQIPVNQAKHAQVTDYHRDGAMRVDGNYGAAPAYTPNSAGYWSAQPDVMEPPLDLSGAMYAYDPKDDPTDDCFRAGGDLWRVMTEDKRALLISNTAADLASVTQNVQYRHAVHCLWADEEYGVRMTRPWAWIWPASASSPRATRRR
jgi:catalase